MHRERGYSGGWVTRDSVHDQLSAAVNCLLQADRQLRGSINALLIKWLNGIALHGKPILELRSVTCHMGSHSATRFTYLVTSEG